MMLPEGTTAKPGQIKRLTCQRGIAETIGDPAGENALEIHEP